MEKFQKLSIYTQKQGYKLIRHFPNLSKAEIQKIPNLLQLPWPVQTNQPVFSQSNSLVYPATVHQSIQHILYSNMHIVGLHLVINFLLRYMEQTITTDCVSKPIDPTPRFIASTIMFSINSNSYLIKCLQKFPCSENLHLMMDSLWVLSLISG